MSLEAKIELLTSAVLALTQTMIALSATGAEVPLEVNPVSAPLDEILPANTEPKIVEELPNEEPKSSPTTDTSPPSSNESPAVTYDDVKAVTIEVSKIHKNKAVAGLARFGVTTAKALNEDQWPAYVEYMQKVAAGEVDPESSHE